jgi:hypothetical protein
MYKADNPQVANPSVAALYEDALVYETGSAITASGALSAYSGAKTGRSPSDKRIVEEDSSKNNVWWGPVNKPMNPDVSFHSLPFTLQVLQCFVRNLLVNLAADVMYARHIPDGDDCCPHPCTWRLGLGCPASAFCTMLAPRIDSARVMAFSLTPCLGLAHQP